ncbi:unnamed protein product [Calypogeia fissa]
MGTEMGPKLEFTNVVVTTVEPLEATSHVETIDPTDNDMFAIDGYLPTLFAYRLADNSDVLYREMVDRIKQGLRKVLVPFFPWAGRWIAIPEGRGRRLVCNDKGIPFIEARVVDKDLDSVLRISSEFRPVPELQGYGVLGMKEASFKQRMLPDGLPCAFAQVTRFRCGGLVVAVTFNHMLADGKSLLQFLTAWSDFSRTGTTDMIMDHNRAAIQGENPGSLPSDTFDDAPTTNPWKTKSYEGTTDMIMDHNRAAIQGENPGSLPSDTFDDAPTTNPWKTKSYEVRASVIESLKREVNKSGDGAYVSTMDCIYAHMLKSASSLPFSITGGKEIGVLNAVDGRTRFYDPPVPNLLGNITTIMRAPKIKTDELLNMPLSIIATKIRDKIATTKRETWLSPERVGEAMDVFVNKNILPWGQTCWSSFPMYSIYFGFGTPFFAPGLNSPISQKKLGNSYIGPPTPGVASSAAFMQVMSTPKVLEALEQQPDFLQFFLPLQN